MIDPSKPERIADNVWLLPAPLSGGFVSLYLIKGTTVALVDSGFAIHAEFLAQSLHALGMAVSDIGLVINTHGHPDHAGGNGALRRISTARFMAHAADAALMKDALTHPQDLAWGLRTIGDEDAYQARSEFLASRVDPHQPVFEWVEAGDVIDLGRRTQLEVMHTPGHTHGSICLVLNGEIAFTGDAVQGAGANFMTPPLFFDADSYARSLTKLQERELRALCLAHPFVGTYGQKSVVRGTEVSELLTLSTDIALYVDELATAAASVFGAPEVDSLRIDAAKLQARASSLVSHKLDWPHLAPSALCTLLSALRQRGPIHTQP